MPDQTNDPKPEKRTKRPDDRRGAPKGQWGNAPHQYNPDIADQVRKLAKLVPVAGEHLIAAKLRMSRDTLRKYYATEIEEGRADMVFSVASQFVARALDEKAEAVKGDQRTQAYILGVFAGYKTKVEVSGPNDGPIASVNLSDLSPEQLRAYGALVAASRGIPPEEVVGGADD